jgi:hypothetical protein
LGAAWGDTDSPDDMRELATKGLRIFRQLIVTPPFLGQIERMIGANRKDGHDTQLPKTLRLSAAKVERDNGIEEMDIDLMAIAMWLCGFASQADAQDALGQELEDTPEGFAATCRALADHIDSLKAAM